MEKLKKFLAGLILCTLIWVGIELLALQTLDLSKVSWDSYWVCILIVTLGTIFSKTDKSK